MPTTVPDVVTLYFALDADRDIDAILALFTDDATVLDEGETYRGTAEIHGWQTGAASKYTYSTTILNTENLPTGDYRVKARLDGNFPGETVELKFDFTLTAEHISKLEITP
ncbi:MAG TPA: nuclear transport factor 2 family protein [Solirubrobacteraceae bacterium]